MLRGMFADENWPFKIKWWTLCFLLIGGLSHAAKIDPSKKEPLEIFGLSAEHATNDSVKKLWRAFAMANHPDKFINRLETDEELRNQIEKQASKLVTAGEGPVAAYARATKMEKDRLENEFKVVANAYEGLQEWLERGKSGSPRSHSGGRQSAAARGNASPSGDYDPSHESWEEYQKRNGVTDRGPDFDYFQHGDFNNKFRIPENDPHYDAQGRKIAANYSYDPATDVYTEHYTSLKFARDPRFGNEYVNLKVGMYLNVDETAQEASIYDPERHAIYLGAVQGWIGMRGARTRKFIAKSWGITGNGEPPKTAQRQTTQTALPAAAKGKLHPKDFSELSPEQQFLARAQTDLVEASQVPLSVSSTGEITGVWRGNHGFGHAPDERDWGSNPPPHRSPPVILAIVAHTKSQPESKRMYAEAMLRMMDEQWDGGVEWSPEKTLAFLKIPPFSPHQLPSGPCGFEKFVR